MPTTNEMTTTGLKLTKEGESYWLHFQANNRHCAINLSNTCNGMNGPLSRAALREWMEAQTPLTK